MDKIESDMMFKSMSGYPDQTIECVPDLADMVTLTGTAAGTWVSGYGTAAMVLAASSNTYRRRIIGVLVGGFGHAGTVGQIKILQGTTAKAVIPVNNKTLVGNEQYISLPSPVVIETGYDIKASYANSSAQNGEVILIKLVASPL